MREELDLIYWEFEKASEPYVFRKNKAHFDFKLFNFLISQLAYSR